MTGGAPAAPLGREVHSADAFPRKAQRPLLFWAGSRRPTAFGPPASAQPPNAPATLSVRGSRSKRRVRAGNVVIVSCAAALVCAVVVVLAAVPSSSLARQWRLSTGEVHRPIPSLSFEQPTGLSPTPPAHAALSLPFVVASDGQAGVGQVTYQREGAPPEHLLSFRYRAVEGEQHFNATIVTAAPGQMMHVIIDLPGPGLRIYYVARAA